MASLAQLLASHGCILVLDAASTQMQVGLLRHDAPAVWHRSTDEAGKAAFALTDACLRDAELTLADVRAFAFCSGPGSMLGVRTVAMALRTWQALAPRPAFQYESLHLLALELARVGAARPFTVIADARRDTWHVSAVDAAGAVAPLRRVPAAELAAATGDLWQPPALRTWSKPPRAARPCDYDLPHLFAQHAGADVLHAAAMPDAFQHEAPEYKKWSARVHSAASVPPR
ncbi:MAG: peptidase M22 [Opitutus sp.]|nr:peptidase M22 [Opitutus sp.]